MLVAFSCHSAGSNKYESTQGERSDRWVEEVARDTNVFAVGTEGSTASANHIWATELMRYAMEAVRFPRQAVRAYRPGGQLDRNWRGWPTARGQPIPTVPPRCHLF